MRNNILSFCTYVSNSRLKISSIVHDCPPRRTFTSLESSRGHDVLHFNQALTLLLWFGVSNTWHGTLGNTEFRIYLAGKELLWLVLLHFISMKIWGWGGGSRGLLLASHCPGVSLMPSTMNANPIMLHRAAALGGCWVLPCRSIKCFKIHRKLNKSDVTHEIWEKTTHVYNLFGQRWGIFSINPMRNNE